MNSIVLNYVHATPVSEQGVIGYARAGIQLRKALEARGVKVSDSHDAPHSNLVCWVSVPTHAHGYFSGQHKAMFTMWEATHLPEAFRENIDAFDTIVVPSEQNLELFSLYHPNVHKVPLGVDGERWRYEKRTEPSPYFDFLIGGSGPRKGTDLAFAAFRKVFDGRTPTNGVPRLILKSPRGDGGEEFKEQVNAHLGTVGPLDWTNVKVISGHLSDNEETDLYRSAHCYLQPSRGEGFGLQPLQAIAQGLPTILTDAHGQAEFARLGFPINWTYAKSGYFIWGDPKQWWEPNFDELCEEMLYVYENYDFAQEHAKEGAEIVAETLTWDHVAEGFCRVFKDELAAPYTGDGTWVDMASYQRKYLTMVRIPWTCHVAGQTFHFIPGQRYYEVADVKRILFEAEILDPQCFELEPGSDDDIGLAPEQLARMGEYSAANSHCPSCGQKLGGPTKADEIYAQLLRDAEVSA